MKQKIRTELAGERVLLRRHRAGDAQAIFDAAWESKDALSLWGHWFHAEYSPAETEQWVNSRAEAWEKGEEYAFAIEDQMTGEFLGGCGINRIDRLNLFANLGYWVRSGRAGQGIATEATRLLASFAFTDLGLLRVEIVAAVENHASRRVALKTGARFEAVLRNRLRLRSGPTDAAMFSLIPEDIK
ncbi:MAG TPA: GNAT family N-acetyltransferase [bacterium]|nr:GNAT family N-acetyltransferase [bacterium]